MSNTETITTTTLDYVSEVQTGSAQEPATPGPAEFQRFAELAGKLTQVPKSELEEKRQEA